MVETHLPESGFQPGCSGKNLRQRVKPVFTGTLPGQGFKQ
jgi:hypothetical protein